MDIAPILALVIAVISATIALMAYIKQKEVSKISANLLFLDKTQSMLHDHPELLELHGIRKSDLKLCDVTEIEFVYILNSLYSGLSYYAIDGRKNIVLSNYRVEFLNNPKVMLCWKNLIRKRMIYEGNFSDAIDQYYGLY